MQADTRKWVWYPILGASHKTNSTEIKIYTAAEYLYSRSNHKVIK